MGSATPRSACRSSSARRVWRKNMAPEEIARELVDWMAGEMRGWKRLLVLTHVERRLSLSQGFPGSSHRGGGVVAADGATLASASSVAMQVRGRRGARQQAPRCCAVSGEAFAQPRYATDAAAAEALCRAARRRIVVAPGTRAGAGALRAWRAGWADVIDTHITGWARAGEGPRRRRAGSIASAWKARSAATRDPGSCCWMRVRTRLCRRAGERRRLRRSRSNCLRRGRPSGIRSPQLGAQTIRPDAKVLFVAGAGWTKKQPDGQTHVAEAGEAILAFLRLSGASLGSSKSLADQKARASPGAAVPDAPEPDRPDRLDATPPKGPSTCCHGEEPHVVGWRFIGERRAISLDANCGWTRGKADVVYVADAFDVMARVNALLESRTS